MRESLGERVWAGQKKIDEEVPRREGMGGSKKKWKIKNEKNYLRENIKVR